MKIVFATNNQHKLQEIRDILGSDSEVVSLKDIGCDLRRATPWKRMPCKRHSMCMTITISVALPTTQGWR